MGKARTDRSEERQDAPLSVRLRNWLPGLSLLALSGLLALQAFAYGARLTLSLGPRVILEPWLLRQGYVLYEETADLHSPLLPLLLSAVWPLFPDGLTMAKTVLVVVVSVATCLTYLAGKRDAGWMGGVWAAWFFVVWSPTFVFGKLWHEAFLTPLYSLILLSYDPAAMRRSPRSLLWLGFLGGAAIMIKQHAVVVLAALVLWNALAGRRRGRSVRAILHDTMLIGLAALLPLIAFIAYQLARAGTLRGLLYWTLGYNLTGPYHEMAALRPMLSQVGTMASVALLLPAALLHWMAGPRQDEGAWLRLGWGLILLATSVVTAYPRFHFFHLQPALPILAWLSVQTLAAALRGHGTSRTFAAGTALALSLYWALTAGAGYRAVLEQEEQYVYEYSNLIPVAEEVLRHTAPGERIFIFPDDEATANLYYLTGALPPKPWIFTYPWYMMDWVEEEILSHLETDPPDWIVSFPERWDIEDHAPRVMDYIAKAYRQDTPLTWEQGQGWLLQRKN